MRGHDGEPPTDQSKIAIKALPDHRARRPRMGLPGPARAASPRRRRSSGHGPGATATFTRRGRSATSCRRWRAASTPRMCHRPPAPATRADALTWNVPPAEVRQADPPRQVIPRTRLGMTTFGGPTVGGRLRYTAHHRSDRSPDSRWCHPHGKPQRGATSGCRWTTRTAGPGTSDYYSHDRRSPRRNAASGAPRRHPARHPRHPA